jgi:hypothetical protein
LTKSVHVKSYSRSPPKPYHRKPSDRVPKVSVKYNKRSKTSDLVFSGKVVAKYKDSAKAHIEASNYNEDKNKDIRRLLKFQTPKK